MKQKAKQSKTRRKNSKKYRIGRVLQKPVTQVEPVTKQRSNWYVWDTPVPYHWCNGPCNAQPNREVQVAPIDAQQPVANNRLRHVAAPSHGKTRCHCPPFRHRLVPPTGTYSSLFFWYRLVALTGAYTGVLVPGNVLTRYQTPYL